MFENVTTKFCRQPFCVPTLEPYVETMPPEINGPGEPGEINIYFYLFQAPGRLISIHYALVWCFPPSRSFIFLFSWYEIPPGREMPSDASFFL